VFVRKVVRTAQNIETELATARGHFMAEEIAQNLDFRLKLLRAMNFHVRFTAVIPNGLTFRSVL
jgi:hypothetical protein